MSTLSNMVEEIKRAIADGTELEELRDNSGECIDGYLPIYNNRIVEEWQSMPSEYDNRGYTELGGGGDVDIIHLMTLDLYLYYSDLWYEALSDVESELEGASNEAN